MEIKERKILQDFPEYVAARERFETAQRKQLDDREREIALQSLVTDPARRTQAAEFRTELFEIEKRRAAVNDELEDARGNLDFVRSRLSVQIIDKIKPLYVAGVRRVLAALKEVSAANDELIEVRGQLERDGVETGSLQFALFNLGGKWDDPDGGRVVGYRREIAANFPELKSNCDL